MITRYKNPQDSVKLLKIQQAFNQKRPLFDAFFNACMSGNADPVEMLQYGNWLVADHALMFVPNSGWNVTPLYFCIAPDPATLTKMCDAVFSTGAVKIKLLVRDGSAESNDAEMAGFSRAGILRSEALLGGRLYDMVIYERFHPQWDEPVGEPADQQVGPGSVQPLQPGEQDAISGQELDQLEQQPVP